jgi:hypothetical protein
VLGREPVEGRQVRLGVLQQPSDLGGVGTELVDNPTAKAAVKMPQIVPDTSGCWARAT